MSTVRVAAIQCALGGDYDAQRRAHRAAGARGRSSRARRSSCRPSCLRACTSVAPKSRSFFAWAEPFDESPHRRALSRAVAKELEIALPISFFERDGQHYYNSVAMVDAGGSVLGRYRKSHIPDGPGYEEKFYFRARRRRLQGLDDALTPRSVSASAGTSGSPSARAPWRCSTPRSCSTRRPSAASPRSPTSTARTAWQRAMIGHAVCNVMPVIAANRIGNENGQVFYGSSFICDHRGDKLAELGRNGRRRDRGGPRPRADPRRPRVDGLLSRSAAGAVRVAD